MSGMDWLYVAAGIGWFGYVIYEAWRTYHRTPGDDWMTAFHSFASIAVARGIEAAGAALVVLDSIPATSGLLPTSGVGATMIAVARVIAQVRLLP